VTRATDFGLTLQEMADEIEAMEGVRARVKAMRLQAGPLTNLGDMLETLVPKMAPASPAMNGGTTGGRSPFPTVSCLGRGSCRRLGGHVDRQCSSRHAVSAA
jgi:4-oxalomesaconate tautomerase